MKVLCIDTLATRLDILQAELSFRKEVKSFKFWSLKHEAGESMKRLADFVVSENIQIEKLAIALPGSLCSYHSFSVPFKKKRDIDQNVQFEIEERVPFEPENIYHAYQILSRGRIQSDIFATIIPKDLYHKFMDQIRQHQLEPDIITPGPVAMAYSMLPLCKNSPNPIMAIEIRDITTYIVVCMGSLILVCRAYPMGLNHFLNAHSKYRNLAAEEAYEELKSAGPQFPPGEIPDELRDIIKPFFVEIKKTIMNMRSQGHNYISTIYLSGYATEWESFEELLGHEFQIQIDRHLLREKYKGDDTPSLITNGLLQVLQTPTSQGLINLRIREHRAKQSIEELIQSLGTPRNQSLFRYTMGTTLLILFYVMVATTLLSSQRTKLETKLKETMKKTKADLSSFAQLPKGKVIGQSKAISKSLDSKLRALETEVLVLKGSTGASSLELVKGFVDRAPLDFKSDILSLAIKDRTLDVRGSLFEGNLEQFRKRLLASGKVKSIDQLKQEGDRFTMSVTYE